MLLALKISSKYFGQITAAHNSSIYFTDTNISAFWRHVVDLIIIIVLVLLLVGSFPVFPYSRDWGYRGTGGLGTILLIVIILVLLHVI
jgi:hypothetical protein